MLRIVMLRKRGAAPMLCPAPWLLTVLLLCAPLLAQEGSPGEAAQAARAQSAAQPARRVYTNRDAEALPSSAAATPRLPSAPSGSLPEAAKASGPAPPPPKDAKLSPEARQSMERVARLRGQLALAQQQLEHLQQMSLNWTVVCKQDIDEDRLTCMRWVEQQNQHGTELIATQRTLLQSLAIQLQSAREAARHAGVAHVDDIAAAPANAQ